MGKWAKWWSGICTLNKGSMSSETRLFNGHWAVAVVDRLTWADFYGTELLKITREARTERRDRTWNLGKYEKSIA